MKEILAKTLVLVAASSALESSAASLPLRLPQECTLKLVARKMGIQPSPSISAPGVFLQSRTPLKQFQDAIEPQWGFRPSAFTNAFAVSRNEIYLLDDEKYYTPNGRTPDDSLAHEFAHFVQVRYQKVDLGEEESAETDAVSVQTWFRETIMNSADPLAFCGAQKP